MVNCFSVIILVFGIFFSCSDKQDFDQYDDLRITPTYESSLLYVEAPERIINSTVGLDFVSQVFNFDAFNQKVFVDRVLDGAITYQLENTTSKRLFIEVDFLDDSDNVLDTEIFFIEPAPTPIVNREIVYGTLGRSIDIITNTSNIRVSAENLGDNTSTSGLPNAMVTLKSSAKFRVRLK